jgi:hypothetical protein
VSLTTGNEVLPPREWRPRHRCDGCFSVRPGERPFRARSDRDLAAAFESALSAGDGVTGAHCIHERWMRGHFAAHIETALDQLWKRAGSSIPDWLPMRYVSWLPAAYEIAARFTASGRGRSNI